MFNVQSSTLINVTFLPRAEPLQRRTQNVERPTLRSRQRQQQLTNNTEPPKPSTLLLSFEFFLAYDHKNLLNFKYFYGYNPK